MRNRDLLKEYDEFLHDEKSLMLLRGQLLSPEVRAKESGEVYYSFVLKVLEKLSEDEYGQRYSMYFCIVSSEMSAYFSKEEITGLKGQEILALLSPSCRVRTVQNAKYNNASFYVHDMMLSRQVEKPSFTKVMSL